MGGTLNNAINRTFKSKGRECDLNNYIIVKEDTLYIDGDETYEAGDIFLACMGISCEFDLIQFANDYGLKELEQDERNEN